MTTKTQPVASEPSSGERVLAALDALGDDAAVHIYPDDLEMCQHSECAVTVFSVRVGNPDMKSVPLFSREQVSAALLSSDAKPARQYEMRESAREEMLRDWQQLGVMLFGDTDTANEQATE